MSDAQFRNPEVPLVSAIMVVGRSPQWQVQLAVNCFANQTYPNKELLIINNCRTQWEAAGLDLKLPADATVIDADAHLSAGMCRNYGISAANGDLFIQFDSHCWHSPYRIEAQLEAMLKYQAHICVLSRGLEYSYCSGYAGYWTNRKGAVLNTMMYLRPKEDDYKDVDKGEELSLINKMVQSGYKPITIDRPHLIMRSHYCSGDMTKKVINLPGPNALDPKHLAAVRKAVRGQALPGAPAAKAAGKAH